MEQLARILFFVGIILVVAGLILYFFGNKLSWLGHLPGDIRIVRDNVKIFIPITTMILISVILSVILYFLRRLF